MYLNAPETATYFFTSLDDNHWLAVWKCFRDLPDRLDVPVDNHNLSPCQWYNDMADDCVLAPMSCSCHLDEHL